MSEERLKGYISQYVKEKEKERKIKVFGYLRVGTKEQLQGTSFETDIRIKRK